MDLDDVADAVEVNVPDVLDDERARDRAIAVAHQELEQRVLLRLEIDPAPCPRDDPSDGVHLEIRESQPRLARTAAAQQRAKPRRELGQRERLGHVVIRAAIQPADTILDRVFRREDQHRQRGLVPADVAQHLQARSARQHQVENDGVVVHSAGLLAGVAPVGEEVDGVALLLESSPDEAGHFPVVLDHQHAHHPPIRSRVRLCTGGSCHVRAPILPDP